jgi:glycosyltransferase involved in cell wall biosynthesis
MKVLFFIESLRCGGKEKLLVELISELSKKSDFSSKVVILINSTHNADQLPSDCELIILERQKIKKDPRLFIKFHQVCSRFKPDLIHVWGNMPAFYSLPTGLSLKIPIVNSQIADSFGISIKQPFTFFSHKINFHFARVITSNSFSGLKSYKIRSEKSRVIYNGTSLERFDFINNIRDVRNELKIRTKYAIVMVGSFSKYKNFDLLLDVAKHYQNVGNDFTFFAVGEGENFEHIKERLNHEAINNVILTGRIKNVEGLVSACDIGILLSPYGEGVSTAIIEYMALGKPVIATNKGGNYELIVDGINGILLEKDNVDEITKAIELLINNEDMRKIMGTRNRKKIYENFSIEKMTNEFYKTYTEVLKV